MVLFSHVPIHDKRFDLFSKMRSASLLTTRPAWRCNGPRATPVVNLIPASHKQACTNNKHKRRPDLCTYEPLEGLLYTWGPNCSNESSYHPSHRSAGQFVFWPNKLWNIWAKAESKPILRCQYTSFHRSLYLQSLFFVVSFPYFLHLICSPFPILLLVL